ncbi:hypothetical protein TCAL_13341 [Tigriopus californicus]|uniref:C2H2-type domain-containing protein n=2 Tax=Tigriopus californicus TaxID=6832 RepID=A0A553NV15_TIGCA|nr:hypothetical protein TCAL_13341 [Tigriopus californicus]
MSGNPYGCHICQTVLLTKVDLDKHLRLHARTPVSFKKSGGVRRKPGHPGVRNTGNREFKCKICKDYFLEEATLQHHLKLVHNKKVGELYHCQRCPAVLYHRDDYNVHMRLHSIPVANLESRPESKFVPPKPKKDQLPAKGPYVCTYCGKVLNFRSSLVIHERTQHGHDGDGEDLERPYVCETCGKGFTSKANMELHSRIHNRSQPFHCDSCHEGFLTRKELMAHARSHDKVMSFKCQYCGKTFAHKIPMLRHERTHTGGKMDVFECGSCDKRYTTKHALLYHMEKHAHNCGMKNPWHISEGISPKTHPATLLFNIIALPQTSTKRKQLFIYLPLELILGKDGLSLASSRPTMSETFECAHCRTTLLTELDLRNHERLHQRHPPTTPPSQLWQASPKIVKVNQTSIRCQMCTDRFPTPKELQRHCRQEHPEHERSDIFSCHFCPAVLFHQSDLATHERLHQVPIDQFSTAPPADQVSKFVAPKTHKKRSTEKGPFICAYCGKMLTTRSSFVIHERTHTGEIPERPFVCETCGKGFTSKCNMLLHSRIHSQETPLTCQTCELTFRTKRELVVHGRSHKAGLQMPVLPRDL